MTNSLVLFLSVISAGAYILEIVMNFRYRIYYINDDGKKEFVRQVFSLEKRWLMLQALKKGKLLQLNIKYLKRSRILLSLEACKEETNATKLLSNINHTF